MKINSIKKLTTPTTALVVASLLLSHPAQASSIIDVNNGEMNFGAVTGTSQPTPIGEGSGLDFRHLYNDVFPGVDAVATVIDIENLDSDDNQANGVNDLVDNFDDNSSSSGKSIDVDIDVYGDPGDSEASPIIPPASETGWVTFRIDFVAADTNNAVTLENISIQVDDIDSNQFVRFAGVSAYELSSIPASELTVTTPSGSGSYEFKEPIGASSSSSDQENWVVVEYAEASSITITLGAREAGGASFGVAFRDTSWTQNPNRTTPALAVYDLTFDENGASSGSAPSAQTSTVSDSTVALVAPQGNLLKTSCTFGGWNTREDGLGANYLNSQSITMTADTTLYAKWTCGAPDSGNTRSLASTGANVEWLIVSGLLAVLAGSCFMAFSRRKRIW
jgi:LPXTG-motif cell wall-anchored protein